MQHCQGTSGIGQYSTVLYSMELVLDYSSVHNIIVQYNFVKYRVQYCTVQYTEFTVTQFSFLFPGVDSAAGCERCL